MLGLFSLVLCVSVDTCVQLVPFPYISFILFVQTNNNKDKVSINTDGMVTPLKKKILNNRWTVDYL